MFRVCDGAHPHAHIEGSLTKATGEHPLSMAEHAHSFWNESSRFSLMTKSNENKSNENNSVCVINERTSVHPKGKHISALCFSCRPVSASTSQSAPPAAMGRPTNAGHLIAFMSMAVQRGFLSERMLPFNAEKVPAGHRSPFVAPRKEGPSCWGCAGAQGSEPWVHPR